MPRDKFPDRNPTAMVIRVTNQCLSNACGVNSADQSPVLYTTSNIIPTIAAIGISFTAGAKKSVRMIKRTLVAMDENWVVDPLSVFNLVCPTNTHPPNPPPKPETILAIPWDNDSLNGFAFMWRWSSTPFRVMSDSISPANAMDRENGAIFMKLDGDVQSAFGI